MWIVPTDANRQKVDIFFDSKYVAPVQQPVVITPEEKVFIKKIEDLLMKKLAEVESALGREAKAYFCGRVFRTVVHEHPIISRRVKWEKFVDKVKIKMIEMCNEGMIEAYIAFSVYFPEMCTREIQPFFFFGGRNKKTSIGEKSVYSDRRLCSLLKDPVFGTHAAVMMNMTNREWLLSLPPSEELPQRTGEWSPPVVEDSWGAPSTSEFGKFTTALKAGLGRELGKVKVVVASGFTKPHSKSAVKWSSWNQSSFSEDLRLHGSPIEAQELSVAELHSVLATTIKHPIVLSSMVWGLCGDEGRREIVSHF